MAPRPPRAAPAAPCTYTLGPADGRAPVRARRALGQGGGDGGGGGGVRVTQRARLVLSRGKQERGGRDGRRELAARSLPRLSAAWEGARVLGSERESRRMSKLEPTTHLRPVTPNKILPLPSTPLQSHPCFHHAAAAWCARFLVAPRQAAEAGAPGWRALSTLRASRASSHNSLPPLTTTAAAPPSFPLTGEFHCACIARIAASAAAAGRPPRGARKLATACRPRARPCRPPRAPSSRCNALAVHKSSRWGRVGAPGCAPSA